MKYALIFHRVFDVLNTLLVAYKHTYFAQRNRMKCGHSRNLFYVSRSCFSFHVHTFVAHLNKWNTRWDFIFTAAAGRPPALAALPGPLRAAVDQDTLILYRREPLQRTAKSEPSAGARLVILRELSHRPVTILGILSTSSYVSVPGSRVISLRSIWLFMWSSSSYMLWIHYLWHINTLILHNGI